MLSKSVFSSFHTIHQILHVVGENGKSLFIPSFQHFRCVSTQVKSSSFTKNFSPSHVKAFFPFSPSCSTSLPIYKDTTSSYVRPKKLPIPLPRGDIQDVESFLHAIGRDSISLADKITSWDMLFSSDSNSFKKLGIPTKQRKYLLLWIEYYRQGKPLGEIMAGRWPKRNKRKITNIKRRTPKLKVNTLVES
ncbi:hypothetical protein HMI55_001582 [Coelomomyces lativittatus]|nr:hypothetical protein HMI56_002634 [Coelomomyces lativittatus]KAJ1505462.1 hypothetical protein HMI55_001582 [Coelomomyces lativittatus]